MAAVLLTANLMVSSRAAGAAEQLGVVLQGASSPEQAISFCRAQPMSLLLIDLELPSLDTAALVGQLRALDQPPQTIVAFGPHVQEAKLAAARAAGCDHVLSRGQWHAQIEELLAQHAVE